MNNNVVLKAVGLQKSYKEGGRLLHVLKDVNLEVHEGESVAIVGTSGSGKTTLLQCIGGLDRFDKGLIEIGGENIAELSEQRLTELRNRRLGFVYQFHHLLPEFTAMENVAMPLKSAAKKRLSLKRGLKACSTQWDLPIAPIICRASCPAANVSVSLSPEQSAPPRCVFWPMSLPATWTARRLRLSSTTCSNCRPLRLGPGPL